MFELNPTWQADLATAFTEPQLYLTVLIVLIMGMVFVGIVALIWKVVYAIVQCFRKHFTITITVNK